MKYRIISFVFILTLFTAALTLADADVRNLVLSRQGDQTVLRVDVSEKVTSKQFAVDAADDKPYRIIVDIEPAIHRLTMKNYMSLPSNAIRSIRTSQYSVDPDRIVRIVLDMNKQVPYEAEYRDGYLFIYIKDKDGADFLTWNSASIKPPVLAGVEEEEPVNQTPPKAKEKPVNTDSPAEPKAKDSKKPVSPFKKDYTDKKPTYAGGDSAPAKKNVISDPDKTQEKTSNPYTGGSGLSPVLAMTKENQPAPPPKQIQQGIDWSTWTYVRPRQSRELDKEITLANKFWRPEPAPGPETELAQAEPPDAQTPSPVIPDQKMVAAKAKVEQPKVDAPQKETVSPVPQPGPVMASLPVPQDTNPQQSHPIFDNPAEQKRLLAGNQAPPRQTPPNVPPKPQLAVNTPVDTLLEETPSSADTATIVQADSKDEKSTSRFRRKPAFPTKLKGTIVAEFPTRMVIKYTPTSNRDPFETLINETKKSDSPIEKKIPDIETARLVGVLESSNGDRRALLEDLDGYGYILKTGDKVKKGYVGKIDSDKAYFRLFEYGWSRTVALYLSHK